MLSFHYKLDCFYLIFLLIKLSLFGIQSNKTYTDCQKLNNQNKHAGRGVAGSAITNGREPRSCLGRVFNSKLGCIAALDSKCMVCMQPLLKLKTRPKACPVS